METPFMFGEPAESGAFINRAAELKRLKVNFKSRINTIIISPRRWGKTSLVHAAGKAVSGKKHKVCHVNLQRARSEQDFYELYLKAVLKATTGRARDVWRVAEEMLERVSPAIRILSGGADFDLKLEWSEIERSHDEILELPNKIATRKDIALTVCIDEFQNIEEFEDSLALQRTMRAIWQHHRQVGYCLYGSKKHMMFELFETADRPFYRFGDMLFLEKISADHWVPFIEQAFRDTRKVITREQATRIADMMDNHPYFVQYFAHLIWTISAKRVTDEIIEEAVRELFNQHIFYFDRLMDQLSRRQVNLLRALIDGEENLSSQTAIRNYDLGSSSSVTTARRALLQKEILDEDKGGLFFQDPPFKLWLERRFFAS